MPSDDDESSSDEETTASSDRPKRLAPASVDGCDDDDDDEMKSSFCMSQLVERAEIKLANLASASPQISQAESCSDRRKQLSKLHKLKSSAFSANIGSDDEQVEGRQEESDFAKSCKKSKLDRDEHSEMHQSAIKCICPSSAGPSQEVDNQNMEQDEAEAEIRQVATGATWTDRPASLARSNVSKGNNKEEHQQDESAAGSEGSPWAPNSQDAAAGCTIERGGPTPTNDLIRALIHKDRLAWTRPTSDLDDDESNGAGKQKEPQLAELDPKRKFDATHKCNLQGAQCIDPTGAGPTSTNHRQTAATAAASKGKPTVDVMDDSMNNAAAFRATRTSKRGHNQLDKHANKHNSTGSPAKGRLVSQKGDSKKDAGHFDLTSLIGMCQQMHLQAPALSGQSPTANQQQQRKPSDPTAATMSAARRLETTSQHLNNAKRRHSTYMLPLILRERQQNRLDDDDDDDEDDNSTSSSSDYSTGQAEDDEDIYLDRDAYGNYSDNSHQDDDLQNDCDVRLPRLLLAKSDNKRKLPVKSETRQKEAAGHLSRLRASASSPSSLMTPTNGDDEADSDSLDDGCNLLSPGKALLASGTSDERLELLRLAAENAALSRQLFSNQMGNPKPVRLIRNRLGSNPLERLRSRPSLLAASLTQNNPSGQSQLQTGKSAPKRHSIISMIAPAGLFGAGKSQNKQRNSLGNLLCNSSKAFQLADSNLTSGIYDPLIPESGFKIVVMGTSGSGKTSIVQRFLYDYFDSHHNPTVEDTYFVEFPYLRSTINISITDTSGTYQFPAMKKLAINSGDAFILVYSVDEPQSFDELQQLRQNILDEREKVCSETNLSVVNKSIHESRSNLPYSSSTLTSHKLADQNHGLQTGSVNNSLNSSFNSSSSCSSSTDSSRRSSVSAAEAALRTRRTRRPPMVIVANKHDLPMEKHLVNSDEIEATAVVDWNNGFVRASAATNVNISLIFQQVLKQAKQPPKLAEAIVSKRRKSLPPKLPNLCSNNNPSVKSQKY